MSADAPLWRVPDWFPDLPAPVTEGLHGYWRELMKFNVRVNLISKGTERDADEQHFADCILASRALATEALAGPVYDVGSGNGMPGLVFAILSPAIPFVLVESDVRKAEFLKHVAHTLSLRNVSVYNLRVESLPARSVTHVISRGFASLTKACGLLQPAFAPNGAFYHLKGANYGAEIAEMPVSKVSTWNPAVNWTYVLPVQKSTRVIVKTVQP